MTACYISEMMTKFFGDGWRFGGKMAVASIVMVHASDTVSAGAQIKEKEIENGATCR